MLMPAKPKHRKHQRGRRAGKLPALRRYQSRSVSGNRSMREARPMTFQEGYLLCFALIVVLEVYLHAIR